MARGPDRSFRAVVPGGAALLVLFLLAHGCLSLLERGEEPFRARLSEAPREEIERKAQETEELYRSPRTVERVERSLDLALDSVSAHNRYQGLWQAARAYAWLAERHPDTRRRLAFARKGVGVAREAVRLAPQRAEPYYYLAVNLGRLSGLRKTARHIDEMAESARSAIERDESFDHGGPHRFLGVLHLRTQGRLLVGFGDLDLALQHLQRAVDLFPQDAENRVYYAEALIEDEDYPAARQQLEAATAGASTSSPPSDDGEWAAKAQELATKINGK